MLGWSSAGDGKEGNRVSICRIWWPEHACCHKLGRTIVLGWENRIENCMDVVVAAFIPMDNSLPSHISSLKGLLQLTNEVLPKDLGELSILGECFPSDSITAKSIADELVLTHSLNSCFYEKPNDKLRDARKSLSQLQERESEISESIELMSSRTKEDINLQELGIQGDSAFGTLPKNGSGTCQYHDIVADVQAFARAASTWLQLSASCVDCKASHLHCVPKLHGLQVCQTFCQTKSHVVVYEQPRFGSHDFSLEGQRFSLWGGQTSSSKMPQWMVNLEQPKNYLCDMEKVIVQINCAAAAQTRIETLMFPNPSARGQGHLNSILPNTLLHLSAVTVALGATSLFVFAELVFHVFGIYIAFLPGAQRVANASQTCRTLHKRCNELLAWPLALSQGGKGSSHPDVSMAHRILLRKHRIWTAVAFDMILGTALGGLILVYQSWIMQSLCFVSQVVTNDILRTGCIWLMGVPAGFKLNNELAGVFGTAALNVIQMWSTLWGFCNPIVGHCLKLLAVVAMVLGATVLAAIVVDMISLATIHVFILYQATAFAYSMQLRTLAALWRLFRGRKFNPLRTRMDSYDYTVEQLVVASLMFTPLLLLLPTTSVFYTFFTIIFTLLSFFRYSMQILIVVFSSFPYVELVLWIFKPRMFSSGLSFRFLSSSNDSKSCLLSKRDDIETWFTFEKNQTLSSASQGCSDPHMKDCSATENLSVENDFQPEQSYLVSRLSSNTSALDVLLPVVEQLRNQLCHSSAIDLLYKMVSGERLPYCVSLEVHLALPRGAFNPLTFFKLCNDLLVSSP